MPRQWQQGDPRLKTPSWRAIVREWNRRRPQVCQSPRCKAPHIPIQYGGHRSPWHLDVGHIADRRTDPRQTWTLSDTRPEHATCNRAGGAAITNATRRPPPIAHSQAW